MIASADSLLPARITAELGLDPEVWLTQLRKSGDAVADAKLEIARIRAEMAALEARYGLRGQQNQWEHERKAKLAELKQAARIEAERREERITDGRADDEAHAHPTYLTFLEQARRERQRYAELLAELDRGYAEFERAKGMQTYIEHRVRANESMVYLLGKEAGLTR